MSDASRIHVLTRYSQDADAARLVRNARERVALTDRRETDCRTALTRGLKEYLEQCSALVIDADETGTHGREVRFQKVLGGWADPEVPAVVPSACVLALDEGSYDASRLTPKVFDLESGLSLQESSEFTQRLAIEVWAKDPIERMALVAMLEDALDPVEWMTGFKLVLPHYHATTALYLKQSSVYLDNEQNAQRNHRRAVIMLTASMVQYRRLGVVPRMDVRFALTVGDDAAMVEQRAPFGYHHAPGETVVVYQPGPSGVSGPQGPAGPIGPSGGPGGSYLHVQSTPATIWTINHNLGFVPSVELFSTGGLEIDAEIFHASPNQTIVTFVVPYAGSARLT